MADRILVVDDEPALRRAIVRELRKDFEVVQAATVDEARAALSGIDNLCAVVSDLNVGPSQSGLELLSLVRESFPSVGRVLVSGSWNLNDTHPAVVSGLAHEFVAKPWTHGQLLAAVGRCLGRLAKVRPSTPAPAPQSRRRSG